ncbi:MAG: GWxTD domain-containing protein, partial [Chitinophagales bacterium]|nr:GWxTD domain-containing protein [Chitinophagales bacterium]
SQGLKVYFNQTNVIASSIELVQQYAATTEKNNFSKNGYNIHPLAVPYYSTNMNKLTFYSEIYNADKVATNEDIILTYSIKHAQSNQIANDLYRWTKQHAAPVNILFSELDITQLPTGNYSIVVEAKNKKNEILCSQKEYFQRVNANSVSELSSIALVDVSDKFVRFLSQDSMPYFLRSVVPRAEPYEKEYIMRIAYSTDTLMMKKFFYNYWQKRNSDDPYFEWLKYRQYLAYAEYNYSTPVSYGFESDRGRVYLQYGPPNHLESEEHESGAYPYEIWQYYKLDNNQSNIKFVFCNYELAANEYKLIHSDARGELNDPRWKFKVYKSFKDGNGNTNYDQTEFRDIFGSQVDQSYDR